MTHPVFESVIASFDQVEDVGLGAADYCAGMAQLRDEAQARIDTRKHHLLKYRRSMVELSAAHLAEADADLLADYSDGARDRAVEGPKDLIVLDHGYGWLVYVPAEDQLMELRSSSEREISNELLGILFLARGEGVDFLLFDQDAEIVPNLPIYEW